MHNFKKILVIKPSSLGDVIHSLPLLYSLRKCFPKAAIHWVISKGICEILEDNPLIDRLWIIEKDRWKDLFHINDNLREFKYIYGSLRGVGFDLSIDIQGLLRSGLMSWASKADLRIGFKEAREGSRYFYTEKIKGGRDIHAVDRYLKIARHLGCNTDEVNFPLSFAAGNRNMVESLPGEYAVIVPSAGKEANRWPAERFGEIASMLQISSVVVSSKKDSHIAETVTNKSKGKAISLGGKTGLKELITIIKGARFLISNDTGPMHIAAAFNIPVIAIFGPANPVRTGPYGKIHTIVREDLECSPCYRKKRCSHWRCIEEITVEKVYKAIYTNPSIYRRFVPKIPNYKSQITNKFQI